MQLGVIFKEDDARQTGIVEAIIKSYPENYSESPAEPFYVVVGGDGAMLDALHRFSTLEPGHWPRATLFGLGTGTLNFLMNSKSEIDRLDQLTLDNMHLMQVFPILVYVDGEYIGCAYNEVLFGKSLNEWHAFTINSHDRAFENYKIKAGGLCLSTPLGSTAMNKNNGGAILPMNLPLFSLTSIAGDRQLNEVHSSESDFAISFSSHHLVSVFIDAKEHIIGHEGTVWLITNTKCFQNIAFSDESEFLRRRIEIMKTRRT